MTEIIVREVRSHVTAARIATALETHAARVFSVTRVSNMRYQLWIRTELGGEQIDRIIAEAMQQ